MMKGMEEFEPFHYPQSGNEYLDYTPKQKYENLAVYRTLKHSSYNRGVTGEFEIHVLQLVPKNTANENIHTSHKDLYPVYFNTERGRWRWGAMATGVIRKGSVYCSVPEFRAIWDVEVKKLYYKVIADDPVLEFTYEMAGLSPRHFHAW